MIELSLSQSAIDKIRADKHMLENARGEPLQPILVYHLNCFETDQDGQTIEYGDGFHLRFRPTTEPVGNDHVLVKGDEFDIFVCVDGLTFTEASLIDYADRAFIARLA